MLVGTPPVNVLLEGAATIEQVGCEPKTLTVAPQVEIFPLPSTSVKTTGMLGLDVQLNVLGDTLCDTIPQLSELALFTEAAVIDAAPDTSVTVTFLQTAIGATLSCTVTVDVQVETLLLTSRTVNVTVLAPLLAQPKVLGATDNVAIPQASLLPLFTCAGVIDAAPTEFNCTVRFLHTATGATKS